MKGLEIFVAMALGLPIGTSIGAMMNFFLCWCFGCKMKRHMVWQKVKPGLECALTIALIGIAGVLAGCVVAQMVVLLMAVTG